MSPAGSGTDSSPQTVPEVLDAAIVAVACPGVGMPSEDWTEVSAAAAMAAAYMAAVLSERSMYIRLSCVETLMALSAFGPSAGLFRLQTTHAQRQHSLCLGGASDSGTSTADMHWIIIIIKLPN
jgi:hypothetical protein